MAQKYFGSRPSLPPSGKPITMVPGKFTPGEIRVRHDTHDKVFTLPQYYILINSAI
jgi:hypothetical protein